MTDHLQAMVIGAGWAGEGHTLALRHCGVEVAAICARLPEVVQGVADQLGIEVASTDWGATLEAMQPDIICLATPASLRREVVEAAAERGCHLFCDKPLATSAAEAARLYRLVEGAGIKHAYGATQGYDPSVVWLGELIRSGAIGTLREVVATCRFGFPYLLPWSWMSTLATGGGLLNNMLPHLLGILATITGGELVQATGEARVLTDRAPVVPGLHDFRFQWDGISRLTPEEIEQLEWRACDADGACSALLQFRSGDTKVPVAVVWGSGMPVPGERDGICLYGDSGTLVADGLFSFEVSRVRDWGAEAEPLPVPQRLIDTLPLVGDDVQNKWGALARNFVADIQGEPHGPYPTFREGWRYQEVIDAIRAGRVWCEQPVQEQSLREVL